MTNDQNIGKIFCEDSIELLEQAMVKIRHCLGQLDEDQVWIQSHPTIASIGNLLLHICGNLRQWSISGVGGLADTRQREKEFKLASRQSKDALLQHVDMHIREASDFLANVSVSQLVDRFQIQGFSVSGLQALNHTVTHFVGHTHQIILLTRQMLGDQYQFAWTPKQGRDQLPI